jgi:hypothetical protein
MQQAIAGQANVVTYDAVNYNTGQPIVSGTVTGYLRVRVGPNVDKWWNAASSTWSATEVSAGVMSYFGGSTWKLSIAAGAWVGGATYDFYAKESGDLDIRYSEQVVTWSPPTTGVGSNTWTYTLTDSESGLPIADAEIWVTTDVGGVNIIGREYSDVNGQVVFYLVPGTYYVWRRKTGYTFDDPDTEVVT